jgi:uncharacterized membrane protein
VKVSFDRYPVTVVISLIITFIDLIIILFGVTGQLRIIFGLPIILFIPGWVLVYALFPTKKTEKGIDNVERIALSFGLSIAIVPLIGLVLNYTPWVINTIPIILCLSLFIFLFGLFAIYRWYNKKEDIRYILTIDINFPKGKTKIDSSLNIIIIILIVISLSLLVYAIISPKEGEKFTEFYLLGPNRIADDYPSYLLTGENAEVIIGVVNHEYKPIDYTVEIWLSNQSTIYNNISKENFSVYNNLWFLDKINVKLDHVPIDLEKKWMPQWEYNYTINITKKGSFKLVFLLYTSPTISYLKNYDYNKLAKDKVDSEHTTSYRSTHIWVNVF